MAEIRTYAKALIGLMDDFGLTSAEISTAEFTVRMKRGSDADVSESEGTAPSTPKRSRRRPSTSSSSESAAATPTGIPVSSPMTGIYYASPSPQAPPFVKEGETVEAGQIVALIEAMKVFNEITAPMSGTVIRVVAANGNLVQPGEPLIYIG